MKHLKIAWWCSESWLCSNNINQANKRSSELWSLLLFRSWTERNQSVFV